MNRKINLQLFADGDTTDSSTETESKQQESEKKYTDEDVNKLIDAKFAEWQKKHQKAVDEAAKLAEMNAQQKAEYERDELQKKLDELTRKNALSEMSATARKMLAENDITIPDELLSVLVSADAEKTKESVEAFSKLFTESVKKAVADALKGNPPKEGGAKTLTKADIMAVKDRTERQKLIAENIDLFK